ncbi:MAG: DUF2061 domain-containing protein [Candidatus Magasanikbacteria bacterium]
MNTELTQKEARKLEEKINNLKKQAQAELDCEIDEENWNKVKKTVKKIRKELFQAEYSNDSNNEEKQDSSAEKEQYESLIDTSFSTKVIKSLSWRVHGSLTTLLISYLFTGAVKLAGGIALTLVVIKLFLYVYHEKLWEFVRRNDWW